MHMPLNPLKENLTVFFNACEELLVHYNLQDFQSYEVKYEFTRKNNIQWTLSQDCKPKMAWILVREHVIEEMEKIESINPCVDNLIEYFGLIYDIEEAGYVSEEFVKNSRSFRKRELVVLFFEYKKLQEEINLSITDFITFLIKGVWSKSIYFKTASQLIGFKTDLEQIKIHNFTIRKPTEEELSRIINNSERWSLSKISNPDDIASVSSSSIQDTNFWIFMEAQQTRQKDPHVIRCLYQSSELNKDNDFIKIKDNLKKLILTLRLYNGNYIGIRSIFINKSFVYESNYFEPWREYPFINPDFANFRQISRSYDLMSKEILLDDVKGIITLFEKLTEYESSRLKQIDSALDHFFNSFEQNYPVYIFTELIMSLETILLENVKANPDEKLNLIKRIREADNEDNGLKFLKEYLEKNSIHKAIKLLNQLLYPEKKNKRLNKFFLDYENSGCYKIRNDLIHGNIGLDFVEIRKKIPDLEEYVRLALLKIIDLRINKELNCSEESYFKKLNEILKT